MSRQPILLCSIFFILGIITQEISSVSLFLSVLLLVFSSIFLFIIFYKKLSLSGIGICFLFFSLGIFSHRLNTQSEEKIIIEKKEKITFYLTDKLNSSEKNRRYEILAQINGSEKTFRCILLIPKSKLPLNFENIYETSSFINRVKPPQYDFLFNYAKYLSRKNIYYQIYCKDKISTIEKRQKHWLPDGKQLRFSLLSKIDKTSLSQPVKELLKGIILADRTEMNPQTSENFTKTGLIHILAISGSHIAVIFWLILAVFKPIFPPRYHFSSIIISIISVWIFAWLIGFGNSVVRSCLMISIFYIFLFFQKKPDLLHSTSLSALIILLIDSHQLFNIGFQLSYMAVLGIYWLNPAFHHLLPKTKNEKLGFFRNIFITTISAQLATIPLSLYYFHQFSIMSFIINLVMIPFAQIITAMGFIVVIIIALGIFFNVLSIIFDIVSSGFLNLVNWFAGHNYGFIEQISFFGIEAITVYIFFYSIRPAIMKKDFIYKIRMVFWLFIFMILRISLNIHFLQKNEYLVFEYQREKISCVKKGNVAIFSIPKTLDEIQVKKYLIDPYCVSQRISFVEKR